MARKRSVETSDLSSPQNRKEEFYAKIAGLIANAPSGEYTREERYLKAILDAIGAVFSPTETQLSAINSGITAAKVALLDDVTFANAGAHNSIYRGKALGDSVTSAQYAAIAAGTFDDLYIGDYWTIDNVNWRIAAFDYYLTTGDTECTSHHIVVVPDTNLYNAKMNDSNVTTGGYVGSAMYTTNLDTAKSTINSYFSGHVMSHKLFLCNAVTDGRPSNAEWSSETVVLMTEANVYGTRWFGVANNGTSVPYIYDVDKSQFPLFRHRPDLQTNRRTFWLRDVVSAARFACVHTAGDANSSNAGDSLGVSPSFCIA